ncbi:hypothetical protein O3M35_001095 [Rhynocoris fuscipes]|uniref:CHK kinase-like domain-containing protein n=1 Tax=Rhynocoris fuscipes TaxID=488301 RepID=A0AAW1DPP5_9HEMI
MDEISKDYLEVMVRRKQDDMRIVKIVCISCKPALGKDENFMSTLLRYKLRVLYGNGESAIKHVLVKSLPEKHEHAQFLQENSFFKNEIHMYSKILRDMKVLMEEFQDKRDTLWCELIGYKPYHKLLLQDLKDQQFYPLDRRENVDMDHARFILKSLARFHTMGAVLLQRNLIRRAEFDPFNMGKEKFAECIFQNCLIVLAKAIRRSWGSEWASTADRMEKDAYKVYDKMTEMLKYDSKRFNVINHGDTWTNNVLFKHVEDTKIPSGVRFVDFQVSHLNSFVWDVTYFIYTSLKPTLRRENYKELMNTYYNSLNYNLKYYNYPESGIPTMEHLLEEMKRVRYWAMLVNLTLYPILSSDVEEPFDMDKALNNKDNPEAGINVKVFESPNCKEMIKDDIKDFVDEGLI